MTGMARQFVAVVLAGGQGRDDRIAAETGIAHKALTPILEKPMIGWVIDALNEADSVAAIHLSTDAWLTDQWPAEFAALPVIEADLGPSRSVLGALTMLERSYPILLVTSDHPLLTGEIIDRFCADALSAARDGADLVVGLVSKQTVMAAYPETKRTWLKFAEDGFTGANLFAFMGPEARSAIEFWVSVEQQRKKPWRLAMAFGLGLLVRYLSGRLSLSHALSRISEVVETDVRAVSLPFAEAAIDVDKPDDLQLVEEILEKRLG